MIVLIARQKGLHSEVIMLHFYIDLDPTWGLWLLPLVFGTYLVCVAAKQQQVEGDGRHQVDEEPSPQVVDRYPPRVRHHLIRPIHVRCAKVDQDIYYESHIHWKTQREG